MLSNAASALALVIEVHAGEPWHAYSTRRILQGITAEHASRHPAGGGHSIWEIVLHMTAWTHEVAARLSGHSPGDPAEGDWPAVGEATAASWTAALDALDRAQRDLSDAATRLSDDEWHRVVGETRDPTLGTGKTRLETLEGLALHHAYHAGQIAVLKRVTAA